MWKKLYVRPIVIYILFLFPYPLVPSIVFYLDLSVLYPWVPSFSEEVYMKALLISLVALFPLSLLPYFMQKAITKAVFLPNSSFKLVKQVFLVIFSLYMLFVLVNFKGFFINHYGDIKTGIFFKIITLFDYFLYSAFVYRLAYLPAQKLSRAELASLGFYSLVKIASGGRMFLVTFILAYAVHYVKQKGENIISLVKLIPLAFLMIFSLGFVVSIRERTFNIAKSFYSLSLEYMNCYISALKSSSLKEDFIDTHYTFFLDPILSFIPSGIFNRENFYFFKFLDSIGGYYAYSPVGGQYLPHQVFLINPSFIFVFIYFFIYAIILFVIDRMTFGSNKYVRNNYVYSLLIFLQSIFLIFSVRHYFFVHIKHLLMVVVFGLLVNLIINLLLKGTGRNESNRIM